MKYERYSLNPNGRLISISSFHVLRGKQECARGKLKGVYEPHYKHISSLALFFSCQTPQQGDMQERYPRTHKSQNTTFVWQVSNARQGEIFLGEFVGVNLYCNLEMSCYFYSSFRFFDFLRQIYGDGYECSKKLQSRCHPIKRLKFQNYIIEGSSECRHKKISTPPPPRCARTCCVVTS